jgi:hypothetical protein
MPLVEVKVFKDELTPEQTRARHVRCRYWGRVIPGWLPVPNRLDGSLLLSHLAMGHPVALTPLLERMATKAIGPVAMEAFERVPGDRAGEEMG